MTRAGLFLYFKPVDATRIGNVSAPLHVDEPQQLRAR